MQLAVPRKRRDVGVWGPKIRGWLLRERWVSAYVFHSKHVKIWSKTGNFMTLPGSKTIEVKDRTTHYDPWLLMVARLIQKRAAQKGYEMERAAEILVHYLFNSQQKGYRAERNFHKKKAESIEEFLKNKNHTAKKDHGWELNELRKAGLKK